MENNINYEETLKELESILEKMETDDLSLEDMMSNYKRAIDLYNKLEKYLNEYKAEIKVVTENGLKDFDEKALEENNEEL